MGFQLVLKYGLWFSAANEVKHKELTNLPQVKNYILFLSPEVIELKKFPVQVGRSSENNLIINNGAASRKHALITCKGWFKKQYFLVDVGSSEGTQIQRGKNKILVNSAPVELKKGDLILIGLCGLEVLI
ncbi:MAG: FHA domain-containing protein [Candidatus Woesearchaeota archaeon]